MSVSRSPAPSSIDLSGVPARVAEAVAQVVAVCHEQFRSDPCPEAFEEAELRVRETMNALACELPGAVIEKRDDGASRIERDGQSWFRVAATPRTIMTSLGPLTYRRARYRSVVRRRRLTPQNRRESTCYHADRRPICTLNNTSARPAAPSSGFTACGTASSPSPSAS